MMAHRTRTRQAQGVTGAGHLQGDQAQIVTLVTNLATAMLRSAGDADAVRPRRQETGTRADATDLPMAAVIIVGVRADALPRLALCLADGGVMEPWREPSDCQKAAACQDKADVPVGPLSTRALPGELTAAARWSLRRDGLDWLLVAGPEQARLRDSRGLHYLGALLANPGTEIPALDLAAGRPGLVGSRIEPLLDATSRDAYRRRIRQLDAALTTADRAGDAAAAELAHQERQALIGELRRATGLAGRPRRAAADAERARINVTRTIRAAIARISAAAPLAGAYLQSSIRTGTACRYQPSAAGPVCWHT